MFRITVERPGDLIRVVELARDSFAIGRVAPDGVVLDSPEVAPDHARIDTLDGGMFVRAHGLVCVNGEAVTIGALAKGDRIAIGPFVLAIELVDDDTEQRLLAALDTGDHASRDIYADWLEIHGAPVRAMFLRLQDKVFASTGGERAELAGELRAIADKVPYHWRMRISRAPIEVCGGAPSTCPGDWGALAPTHRDGERYCHACQRPVRLLQRASEAHVAACFAIDLTSKA